MVTMQVHRFGNQIAAYLGNGETVYLTPAEARAFARALNKAAREISAGTPFTQSTVGTFSRRVDGKRG